MNNANKVRKTFGDHWSWPDNYQHNSNGRIWIIWRKEKLDMGICGSSDKLIHCEVLNNTSQRIYWLPMVYAHNQLIKRNELQKDIKGLTTNINDRGMIIWDYINVLTVADVIGGALVQIVEYVDLEDMMNMVRVICTYNQRESLYLVH